jgi:hypothetical protein
MGKIFERGGKIDETLAHYLKSITSVLLNIVLILAILDIFGVKTTSFAALLAGAGLAIGAAWSGMLGNFAAGVFMQVLRPYKVGDFISAGRRDRHGQGAGPVRHHPRDARQRDDRDRQRQGLRRQHPELQRPAGAPGGLRGQGGQQRGPAGRHRAPEAGDRRHPQRGHRAGAGRRDPGVHARGPQAVRAPLHPHRPLLAGVLRHPQGHRGDLWRGRLSRCRRRRWRTGRFRLPQLPLSARTATQAIPARHAGRRPRRTAAACR